MCDKCPCWTWVTLCPAFPCVSHHMHSVACSFEQAYASCLRARDKFPRLWKVLLLLLLLTSSSRICLCPVCSLSSFMMSVFVIVAFLCVGGKAGGVWCFCILTTLVIVCFLCEACFPHSPWHHRNAMCAHGSLSHFCQPCHCLFPCLVHSDSPGCSSEVQMEDVAPALWPRDGTQKWSLAYGLCVL